MGLEACFWRFFHHLEATNRLENTHTDMKMERVYSSERHRANNAIWAISAVTGSVSLAFHS